MTVVAFQGEIGAFSEEAVYQHFGRDVESLPYQAFEHIFEAVEDGIADFSAVPVENSTAGSINKAYDLLLDPNPENALSDGAQSLTPKRFQTLMNELRPIAEAVGRKI